MQPIIWWSNVVVLAIASVTDLRSRRIPNWLVIPFLCSGLLFSCLSGGWQGAAHGFGGVGLAALLFGLPCFLRAMGMGDLKLAAGVGAWLGPWQFFLAFILTGIAGGILAGFYALFHGSLGQVLDSTAGLATHLRRSGLKPHPEVRIGNGQRLSIPYAPAIAIGTLLSFFAR